MQELFMETLATPLGTMNTRIDDVQRTVNERLNALCAWLIARAAAGW